MCSDLILMFSEMKRVTVKFLGTKYRVHWGFLILRVLGCIVTVSFGVDLVLWLL
jgi:hypothetical protein